jgi:hypothetical protein
VLFGWASLIAWLICCTLTHGATSRLSVTRQVTENHPEKLR